MTFNQFQINGNSWDSLADALEQRLRLLHAGRESEPDPEIPEAEISDAERRAAIARERMRRRGMR